MLTAVVMDVVVVVVVVDVHGRRCRCDGRRCSCSDLCGCLWSLWMLAVVVVGFGVVVMVVVVVAVVVVSAVVVGVIGEEVALSKCIQKR